jgi:hypothetical protein
MKTSFNASHLLLCVLASVAIGCGGEARGSGEPGSHDQQPPASGGNGANTNAGGGPSAITWCSTALTRDGVIAGTSLDYPTTPYTTWFNNSLEEVALSAIDDEMMKEAGLSPDDKEDVQRFKYFAHGFDFRLILGDTPSPGNWFGKTDLSVYLFDVADTATQPNTAIEVFDASAVREARLSGDKSRLASTLRATVDAMKATRRPKAIVAFAPDRNPETSVERAFINLFARDVYFASKGSVTLSNLRDRTGAPIASPVYPLRNVRTLDVSATGDVAATPFTTKASCLDVEISG